MSSEGYLHLFWLVERIGILNIIKRRILLLAGIMYIQPKHPNVGQNYARTTLKYDNFED